MVVPIGLKILLDISSNFIGTPTALQTMILRAEEHGSRFTGVPPRRIDHVNLLAEDVSVFRDLWKPVWDRASQK